MRKLILILVSVAISPSYFKPAAETPNSLVYDWPSWGGDDGGQRYSPLNQIDKTNVGRLRRAWTFHTGEISDGKNYPTKSAFECTPIVLDGVMYITTPFCRVVALDPETGKEFWSFDPKMDRMTRRNMWAHRGLAVWKKGEDRRVFSGTLDGDLWCLDARTGKPVPGFGEGGRVRHGSIGMPDPRPSDWMRNIASPPTIYEDLVIVGGIIPYLRAYDVHTGKLIWERFKAPQSGEPGHETWDGDSSKRQGGSLCWTIMSLDRDRGMLFVPTDSPIYDYYGGDRHGANRWSNSLLALKARTGELIWDFQFTHHDVWDYDIAAQPNLITVRRDGRDIPAVAQVTKQGFLFLLHRETGKPLFEVEERPVQQSALPGEKLSPTQPFPTAPPAFARTSIRSDEIADVSPEHRKFAEKIFREYDAGGVFSAPSEKGVMVFPGNNGGADWGGGCYDPTSSLYFVSSSNLGMVMKMVPTQQSFPAYRMTGGGFLRTAWLWDYETGIPLQAPPWGTLTAIDLKKGSIVWQKPLGIVESLAEKGITNTGAPGIGGGIVTSGGLVFIGYSNDSRFRAFDKDTGKELWVTKIDGSAHAVPVTYLGRKTRKQYVVIAAGGGNRYQNIFADALIAFTLPDE
jgi:glucose dehydrogenase